MKIHAVRARVPEGQEWSQIHIDHVLPIVLNQSKAQKWNKQVYFCVHNSLSRGSKVNLGLKTWIFHYFGVLVNWLLRREFELFMRPKRQFWS